MPKLPTYEELGSNASGLRPAPAALRSIDAARAPGEAVAGVGLKMMDMANTGQTRNNAAQFARDKASLTVLDIKERRRVMEEHPYEDWDEEYRSGFSEKGQAIISANPNKVSRDVLQGEFDISLERGSGFMFGEATKKDVDFQNARMEESLDALIQASIEEAVTPADFDRLIRGGLDQIDAMILDENVDEVYGVQRKAVFKDKMAGAYFDAIGDPAERIRQLEADVGVADWMDDTVRVKRLKLEKERYEPIRAAREGLNISSFEWGSGDRETVDVLKAVRARYKSGEIDELALEAATKNVYRYDSERTAAGNALSEKLLDQVVAGERDLLTDPLDASEMFQLSHAKSEYIKAFANQGGFPQVTNEKWYTAKRDEFFAMSLQEKRDEFDNLAEYGVHLAVADYRVMRAYIEEARYGGGAGIDNMDSGMNKFNERFGAYPIDDQDSESDRFDMHEMLKRDFQRRMMVAQSESEGKMSDEAIFAELDQTFKTVIIEKPWYTPNEEKLMLRLNIDDIEYDNIPEKFRVQWGNTPRSQVKEEYINYLNEQDFGFSDTIDQQTGFVIKRPVGVPEYRPGGSLTNKINSAKAASETATDGE